MKSFTRIVSASIPQLVLGLCLALMPGVAFGYDAASEFSIFNNPSGTWTYGYSTTLGGTFNAYQYKTNQFGLDMWVINFNNPTNPHPSIWHNGTGSNITTPTAYQRVLAGGLASHPGPNGEYSILRWTAPSAGTFSIAGSFWGDDQNGDSADVHVLRNGVALFNGNVTGYYLTPVSYTANLTLSAGDTIDFAVGYGTDGSYNDDLTGLSATIIPEPTTLFVTLQGLILAGVLIYRRRS